MNKRMMREDDDVENMGIMQGFMDSMAEDDEGDDQGEEGPEMMMERRPDSPEILMNNLRGDMRSVSARRDELADLVGYQAATETPDSVLAMLQPVLAQQGGGGIGALPQSQDMAQGPQPPMMGGEMGMPPPGMPPMPPDAGMPPPPQQGGIAELMAGMGGGAPGGGMPPPPQQGGMPPGGQPPIAMARGGYVQNFRAGSDENGVTPAEGAAVPEDLMMYPPDMVAAARRSSMDLFNQRAAPTPTLSEATASRLPEYTKLLGADRGAAEAQMLFDLGQRAFGFAGNVDDAGRPLRGSFMSRLAGAARTLPGAMGKRIDEISKIDRQLKVLALQQGEKDIDQIAAQNAELQKRKGSLINEVLRAQAKVDAKKAGTKDTGPLGRGSKGDILNNIIQFAPLYQSGSLLPEQENAFMTAVTDYTQPTVVEFTDPDSGLKSTRTQRNQLPEFVVKALNSRRPGSAPVPLSVPSAPAGGPASPAPLAEAAPIGTAPPAATEAQPTTSLWNDRFDIAGPVAAVVSGVSKIPGLGDPMANVTLARQNAELKAERLIEALLKSTQGSVREQERLANVINIKPSVFTDPDVYGTRLIALGRTLQEGIKDLDVQSRSDGTQGTEKLTPAQRTEARQRAMQYRKIYGELGLPPAVFSEEEARRFPPGAEVLWQGTQLKRVKAQQ
jgi:hypothetical protein